MPAAPDAVDAAVAACRAADDKKATNLAILEVADILNVVDAFVLGTASNDRQLKAVADEIEHVLQTELDRKVLRREGDPQSGWTLLDYGDIVCHLFSEEARDFYALERLWSDVPRRDPLSGERAGSPVRASESA